MKTLTFKPFISGEVSKLLLEQSTRLKISKVFFEDSSGCNDS